MKVRIEMQYLRDTYDFLFYEDLQFRDNYAIGLPMEIIMQTIPEYTVIEKPTLSLHGAKGKEFIQSFVNEAHRLGFQAEEQGKKIEVIKNELVAVRYHLEDMRRLVFEQRIK